MKIFPGWLVASVGLLAVTLTGCPVTTTVEAQPSPAVTLVASPPALVQTASSQQQTVAQTVPVAEKNTAEPATKEEPKKEEPKKETDANPDRNTRPKADRTPRKPGEAIKITFDNIIIGMQADIPYRPWMMNDEVKELEGKKVSITGVIHGSVEKARNVKSFILLRNKECKYGKGGQADHLADIQLKPGQAIDYTHLTVRVEGTLKIEPFTGPDGNTWSIYKLEDATAKVQ